MSDRKNNFDFSRQSWPKQPSAERVVGERGRKELPPGTKGGENMKPDRHAEHKQHAFDSFCKKVLKCEACNGYREISRRKKHSIPFSELPEDAMEQLAAYDRYDTAGISHVGFYVGLDEAGNPMFLHCGDPIQYARLNTSYWQQHFYAYGRPPYD